MIPTKKLLLLIIVFFVIWRLSLVFLLWHNRLSPPQADDAYVYLANIESVKDCPTLIFCEHSAFKLSSPTGYDHLVYRLVLGSLGKIFHLSALTIFNLSFYLGSLLLLVSYYFFISALNIGKFMRLTSLLTLAFFNGNGLYHGPYWVVPSFFALCLFFITFYVIIKNPRFRILYLLLLIPVGLFTHLIYFYFLVIPVFYSLWLSVFCRRIQKQLVINSVTAVLIAFMFYLPVEIYLQRYSGGYSYGILNNWESFNLDSPGKQISFNFVFHLELPSLGTIYTYYYKYLFADYFFAPFFLLSLASLIRFSRYRLLSILLACHMFTLGSSIYSHGYRSLLITWPVTLVVTTVGIWDIIIKICHKFKNTAVLLSGLYFLILSIFGLRSMFLNLLVNQDHVWDVDDSIIDFITASPLIKQFPVYFEGKVAESYFVATSLNNHIIRTFDPNTACVFITGIPNYPQDETNFKHLVQIFAGKLVFSSTPDSLFQPLIPSGFIYERNFGSLHVFYRPNCHLQALIPDFFQDYVTAKRQQITQRGQPAFR